MHLAIVGNSAAALSALESFRQRDRRAKVTLVTEEAATAYSRVLLPYYLRGKVSYDGLFIRDHAYYERMGAEVISGARVEDVDAAARTLELADGRRLGFDRLLIASGSSPARPSIPGLDDPAVHSLWTLQDALRLDPFLRAGARALVLGSGFVALQAAWAARQRGLDVTVLELDARIMPRVLDAAAARILHEKMVAHRVIVHTGAHTDGLERDGRAALRVHARGLDPFSVDAAIVATGARPNDGLLPGSRDEGQPGIAVTAEMETNADGVFAAGDVTRGPTSEGGPREIHALWPTAVEQGRVAGANLAGAGVVYGGSLSMNVTEMFGLTVASLGRFVEGDGEEAFVHGDLPGILYLKLVARAGVPVGAVAIGGPEAAMVLGRLRPYVRRRKAVSDLRSIVEGSDLSWTLARLSEARSLGPGRGRTKEVERCASSS